MIKTQSSFFPGSEQFYLVGNGRWGSTYRQFVSLRNARVHLIRLAIKANISLCLTSLYSTGCREREIFFAVRLLLICVAKNHRSCQCLNSGQRKMKLAARE